uniref:Uncharacterized protein n=1 Tax=Myoviridae sp. cteo515 TaxID=2823550 RepID=A0A8S5LBI5_9CAUD|nr:MAG TPA: hypothetical protein [Myoviridae sp. cteo515]
MYQYIFNIYPKYKYCFIFLVTQSNNGLIYILEKSNYVTIFLKFLYIYILFY